MKQISELEKILSYFLNWNKARISFLTQIIQSLFRVRTVNLTQIAEAFQTDSKTSSSYRRIQRFFESFSCDMSFIVILVTKLFIMEEKSVLIMDRTNWKWGKKPINILMISIEYFGIAIPLFWTVLDKEGTSSSKDRMSLLRNVIKKLGPEKIQVLLADREFIGEKWFRFLIEEQVPFIIRVKQNFLVQGVRKGYEVPIKELLKKLGRKKRHVNHPIKLWGHSLFSSVEHRKGAKEAMIVVSNQPFPAPLELYRWRWGIETLFGCLKSRGFRIEDTHMVEPLKIEKHGRRGKSIFRVGLDLIRSTLLRWADHTDPHLSLLRYFIPLEPGGYSI